MNIVPFSSSTLPAHIARLFAAGSAEDLTAGTGGGFPVISIKGKVFHIVRGDERTLVTKPDADDEPAGSLEVVLIKANAHLSKTYYSRGFEEGTVDKPDCYSNDGVSPAVDAQRPQSKKCATCPHAQWGSRVSDNGSKGKACSDVRRVAIAAAGQLNDPMLLRVPPASLKTLGEYGAMLNKRGVPYQAVVTRVGFDYSVAHPALTFKPIGFLDEAGLQQVADTAADTTVQQILGLTALPAGTPEADESFAADVAAAEASAAKAAEAEAEAEAEAKAKAKAKAEAAAKAEAKAKAEAEAKAKAEAAAKAKALADAAEAKPKAAKAPAPAADDDLAATIGNLLDAAFDD